MTKTDYTDTRIKQLSKAVTKLMKNNDEFYTEITELKSRIRELEDELDIHQHHIAELESEEGK